MPDDPAALVVPFGKYQGLTVAELLERDPNYVNWLLSQNWLAQRFAELHAAIVTRGATPDDTPEHNQIQARFVEPAFQVACLLAAVPARLEKSKTDEHANITSARERHRDEAQNKIDYANDTIRRYQSSEHNWMAKEAEAQKAKLPNLTQNLTNALNLLQSPLPTIQTKIDFEYAGIDVRIQWSFDGREPEPYRGGNIIKVEIKPSIGDDYPAVMRQMQRLGATILVIDQYASSNIPLSTVREMFKANGQILITLQETFDQIPNAKIFMGISA